MVANVPFGFAGFLTFFGMIRANSSSDVILGITWLLPSSSLYIVVSVLDVFLSLTTFLPAGRDLFSLSSTIRFSRQQR
jgi:hypothetical protein